jgi:hypothetical protein
MKLYDKQTGKELKPGDMVVSRYSREEFILDYLLPPHKPSSEGKISVKYKGGGTRLFYPSVVGAEYRP